MKRFSKEIKVAIAFLLCSALLYVGVNFLKGRNVFSHDNTYYTVVENAGGVVASSVITTNGFQVGTVSRVEYDYAQPNRIVLTLRVKESLCIPKGSRALLVNSLLGGVSIDLRLAQGRDCYVDGDTIPNGVVGGLTDQMESVMLPQVIALVPKVDSLITALNVLVSNPALARSIDNVESISCKLDYTADELNKLFHKELPTIMADLQGAACNIHSITDNLDAVDYGQMISRVDSTITGLQMLSVALTSDGNSVGRLLSDTTFYHNLNGICTNANELIEDVKAYPSRYINISVFGRKK